MANETLRIATWVNKAGVGFNMYYTPVLCLFGALGNCLSVSVFCLSAAHRNLSSSFYLSALAISDTGFLINLLAVWLTEMGFSVLTSPFTCPLIFYLGQVTGFLSVWLTVAFTVERFFAVCYPLTRPIVCTVSRAKKILVVLTIVALLVYSYVWVITEIITVTKQVKSQDADTAQSTPTGSINDDLYYVGLNSTIDPDNCTIQNRDNQDEASRSRNNNGDPGTNSDGINGINRENLPPNCNNESNANNIQLLYKKFCTVGEDYHRISQYANYFDSCMTLIVPFCLITFFNMRIAHCVWKLKDQRESIVAMSRKNNQLHQRNSSKKLKDHLNQSISRRGSINHNCGNHQMIGGSVNGSNGQLCVKINIGVMGTGENVGIHASNSTCSVNTSSIQTPGSVRQRNQNTFSNANSSSSPSHTAAEVRVTKTLLLVSTVFLVLNLPAHTIRVIQFLSLWEVERKVQDAAMIWSNILFNTNFAVNFLLYCVSGRNFRKSLKNIFFGRRKGNQNSRRGTPLRSNKSKPNRMILNNTSITIGCGKRINTLSLTGKPNNTEQQKLFPASVTEVEMETTYA